MSDSAPMPERAMVQNSFLFWLLLSSFQLAVQAQAQSPSLLLDINKKLMPNVSSRPHSFVRVGNKTFFVATGLGVGEELWVSDGTSQGTRLVKDIAPGPLGSRPSDLTVLGQTVFFIANDWKTGKELWKSDGTRQGTVIVKDIGPGQVGGRVKNLRVLGQELLFQALDIPPLWMLWKTDGTKQGTQKLIGPNLKPPYQAFEFVVAGANLFFQGDGLLWRSNGTQAGTGIIPGPTAPWRLSSFGKLLVFFNFTTNGSSLWISDGTRFGTRKIKDLPAGAGPAGQHAVPKRSLFYFLLQLASKTELWRSNGSPNGTFAIASFGPRLRARNFVELGNSVLFQIGNEIWASDGSSNGTRRLGSFADTPDNLTTVGKSVFFAATAGNNGRELWRSDGTAQGTVEFLDINRGSGSSNPSKLTGIGNELFFSADDDLSGIEPWRSDATVAGTFSIRDVHAGRNASYPGDFIQAGSKVLFTADDGVIGQEPWVTDSTANGTTVLKDLLPSPGTASSKPTYLGKMNGWLFFTADDEINGNELWKTDGTTSGTVFVADIYPGPKSGFIFPVAVSDNLLFFGADDAVHGIELWATDGSPRGTRLVADIFPGKDSSIPYLGIRHGNEVFFTVFSSKMGSTAQLWKTDGTAIGTVFIKLGTGRMMTSAGDKVFFSAGGRLFATGGTIKGTRLLNSIPIWTNGSRKRFAVINREVIFGAKGGIWKSDGTVKGTVIIKTIAALQITDTLTVGNRIFFKVVSPARKSVLYATDGSSVGTHVVSTAVQPRNYLGTLNARLLFFGVDNNNTSGLWISDGTGAGTRRIASLSSDLAIPPIRETGSRKLFFTAMDAEFRYDLWETDGTVIGTRKVMSPGLRKLSLGASQPILVNGKVCFINGDLRYGSELWVMDPGATVQRIGVGCPSPGFAPTLDGSDPVLGGSMRLRGTNAPSNVGVLLISRRAVPSLPITTSCTTMLSPGMLTVLAGFNIKNRNWTLPLFIPNLTSLIGMKLVAQAFLPSTSSPLGFELSNGLLMTLGK